MVALPIALPETNSGGANDSAKVARSAGPFDRPVFILAAPRSGSTLLFETLAHSTTLWTIGGEGHEIIEGIESLNPCVRCRR